MSNETITIRTVNLRTALTDAESTIYQLAMQRTRYNQSKAAKLLGVSRGTLRTKLREYFGDRYVGTREDI